MMVCFHSTNQGTTKKGPRRAISPAGCHTPAALQGDGKVNGFLTEPVSLLLGRDTRQRTRIPRTHSETTFVYFLLSLSSFLTNAHVHAKHTPLT